jgi:hypothetical protein
LNLTSAIHGRRLVTSGPVPLIRGASDKTYRR